jgi:hypothetical protein
MTNASLDHSEVLLRACLGSAPKRTQVAFPEGANLIISSDDFDDTVFVDHQTRARAKPANLNFASLQ